MRTETRRQPTRPLVQAGIELALGGLAGLLDSGRVWTALLHGSVAFPEALPYDIVDYLGILEVPLLLGILGPWASSPFILGLLTYVFMDPLSSSNRAQCLTVAQIICSHNYYYYYYYY